MTEPSEDGIRDRYAAAIYEAANPGFRWTDARPDDMQAYREDAKTILTAKDRLARVLAECDVLMAQVSGLNPSALAGRRDAVARIREAARPIDEPGAAAPAKATESDEHSRMPMSWIELHKTLSPLEKRHQERHPDAPRICWCGWEKKPGQDHGMCYPGMD